MDKQELERCLHDGDYLARTYFSSHKFCMAYSTHSCSDTIIGAHIISEKYLKNIADANKQVLLCRGSAHHRNYFYEFDLEYIKRATKINGFCEHHDRVLFESFEKDNDFCGEYVQIFDIAFRALAREYYQKRCLLTVFNNFKNGKLNAIDLTSYSSSLHFQQNLLYLKKNIKDLKFLYDQLKKYRIRGLHYLLIKTSKLPMQTTGVLFSLVDAEGKRIQKLDKKQLGFIYAVITTADCSYIFITCPKSLHNNVHALFLNSIFKLKTADMINYLVTTFFFTNDNVVLNPNWYNSLESEVKNKILNLMNFQTSNNGECHYLREKDVIDFEKIMEVSVDKITKNNLP